MRIFSKAYIPVSLAIVLALSLLLRVQTFRDFPFYNMADYNRDYMVAHYIVADGEYPHAGPGNPFAKRATSPAYYYLMAAPLLIKDSIVTLGIFNIILQLLTLVLVFIFAKRMFGAEVALIATIIFGFADHILNQSAFPWQPYTMQPFLVLSYLLLVLAYRKKSFAYLLSGVPVFFLSLALHNSVLALVPLYLLVAFLILRSMGGTVRHYATTTAACLSSLVVIFAPSVLSSTSKVLYEVRFQWDLFDPFSAIANFSSRTAMFFRIFFGEANAPLSQILVGSALLIAVAVYFFYSKQNVLQKKFMLVMALCVVWLLVAAAFIPLPPGEPLPLRYFTPILGLFTIFVAEIIGSLRGKLLYPLKVLLVVLMVYLSSPNLPVLAQKSAKAFIADGLRYFYVPYQPPPFTAALGNEIVKIKESEKKDNYNFFGFRLCGVNRDLKYNCWPENGRHHIEEMFLVPLELELKTKLAKIDEETYRGYSSLADEQYIFVMCPDKANTAPCLDAFLQSSPEYKVLKAFMAEPYQAYVVKRPSS